MKFSDVQARVDKKNPNMTLDIELNGEEVSVTLRNVLRLTEEASKEVFETFRVMNAKEGEFEALLTEEEKTATAFTVIGNRLASTLRSTADDQETFDKFLDGIRNTGDFNMWMLELFDAYGQETRLGEAIASEAS